jgi:hypothetical protein
MSACNAAMGVEGDLPEIQVVLPLDDLSWVK